MATVKTKVEVEIRYLPEHGFAFLIREMGRQTIGSEWMEKDEFMDALMDEIWPAAKRLTKGGVQ